MDKNNKMKTIEQLEYNLRIPSLYKRTWQIIGIITLFLLLLASVPIIATAASKDASIINALNANSELSLTAKILSYVSYGLICAPFIFLMASWIVGIDNITKSKNFHLFIWVNYTISSLLSIIAIILAFRAYIIV